MMYELLNPMFCVIMSPTFDIAHYLCVKNFAEDQYPIGQFINEFWIHCHRYSTYQIKVLIEYKIVLRYAEF